MIGASSDAKRPRVVLQKGFTGSDLVTSARTRSGMISRVLVRMLYLIDTRVFAWPVLLSRTSACRVPKIRHMPDLDIHVRR
jgi:hypothetical protein